jgi:hypothetical protein
LAPEVGFEPTAKRLTAARSTTELLGNSVRLNIITLYFEPNNRKLWFQLYFGLEAVNGPGGQQLASHQAQGVYGEPVIYLHV